MSQTYKTSYKVYSAWNYQKEIEDLNQASAQGWQLVKGGCFHSRFVKNPDIRFRYQLDYGKVDEMGRYIEMFREQGWEYINSTFNGWHYFRKLYDPTLPEDAYEIFTDRESLHEMNSRWARLALIIGILLAVTAVLRAVFMFPRLSLPGMVQVLTLAIESLVLFRGVMIMRDPDASRSRKGDGTFLGVFLAVILAGCAAGIVLSGLRPNWSTGQQADSLEEPITENRWMSFDVRYPDYYYLDLAMKADEPLTFEIVNEEGTVFYTETATEFSGEDICVRLGRGTYWFSMSATSGFELNCSIN